VSSVAATRKPTSAYRPPPHRSLPPQPPRWAANDGAYRTPPLAEFVLLSILLHVLAILLFGAPSGGSREGRAMWGALNVTISAPLFQPAPLLKLDRSLPMLPMLRAPQRAEPPPAKVVPPPPPPATAPQPVPEAPPPPPIQRVEPIAIPPMLDRLAPPDRKLEMAPTFKVPPPSRLPAPVPPPPVEAPPPPPPAPIPAPRIERVPAEAPPVAAPLAQPLPPPPAPIPQPPVPAPLPAPPVERAPVETPAVPALTPATPPVERPPVEVPVLPVPESVAPARVEPAAKPVEKAPPPDVAPVPAPAPAVPAPAPTAIERAIERAQQPPRDAPAERAPAPSIERAPALPAAPAATTPLPGPSFRDSRPGDFPTGRDRGDYDPTKGALDLDAVRARAGQLGREGSGNRALLPFPMPAVEKPKSKMEKAIESARKPDCKDAYKDLGLAAVIPLVANEFGEGTCRW